MIKLTPLVETETSINKPYMYSKKGFGCHVCEYYFKKDGVHSCNNKKYIEYMGTSELLNPKNNQPIKDPSKYCSNWFEPKKETKKSD